MTSYETSPSDHLLPPHPIQTKLKLARSRWKKRLEAQSTDYKSFKSNYKSRYNLEPPKGMKEWFKIVTNDGVLLVDEFDELMNSLKPFRTMDSDELIRRTIEISKMPTFSLLNITAHHAEFQGQNYRGDGKHYSRDHYGPGIERVEGLASMLQRHISLVPDGTIFAVSELAEPRVIVPWQDHPNTLREFDLSLSSESLEIPYHHRIPKPNLTNLLPTPNFIGSGSSWELYAKSCPPESSARKKLSSLKGESTLKDKKKALMNQVYNLSELETLSIGFNGHLKTGQNKRRSSQSELDFNAHEDLDLNQHDNNHHHQEEDDPIQSIPTVSSGQTFTSAQQLLNESKQFEFVEIGYKGLMHSDLCSNSELHQIQGAFFSDWRGLQALYPVFSPSKIDGFSDILIPSNFYYGDDARYSFEANETISWDQKHDKLFWRGKTTGGGNSPPRHQLQYQRHRFVRLAQSMSRSLKSLLIQDQPNGLLYHMKRTISDLNQAWLDVGFTGYTGCGDPDICDLTAALYPLKAPVPLSEMARYKAILDLDGMAFSGRFVALMSMGSGVIKSTIFKDALTDWIEPWVHYIPLSVGYEEMYNLLGYFLHLPEPSLSKEETEEMKKHENRLTRLIGDWVPIKWFKSKRRMGDGPDELKKVAQDGLRWSETIGNKPDIEAYVLRLALDLFLDGDTDQPSFGGVRMG
ncbi:family 90 glycosyltransferase [Melampsora larici-populina 98AG31]|uniref:Family 90 glycosyltransferase n=1 Tax=Melampsora larici-populina (strain 98AG31 / pathotype 3-4-7) TaxID=747676 RepID=F4S7V9_MELLP|nr:family 90 glycosyltransferase [Melampsora larici-populina 98AG31]EGF99281.1 family 90 glycosyltransferase [Melampsora larici-populina 98AG31]